MRPEYATVVDVIQGKGVKIKKDGEKEALDIYYNNLGAVNVGDKVYIKYTSGSILVVGKVHSGNTDTGGGSSTGVTKEYVDTQDAELSRQINVLSVKTLNVKSQDDWGNDFNNANTNGMYHIINCQSLKNKPPTIENVGNLIVMSGTENNSLSKVQYFIPFNNTGFYMRTRGYGFDEWMEWKEIATTTKTDILVTPTNGLKVTGNNVSFVEEIAGIKIYHGELEAAAPISDNPIVLTLPKFTSNTWRPVTFVKQDTKEAYGGWCYHGGHVRASLPAGKYNIDIIYT